MDSLTQTKIFPKVFSLKDVRFYSFSLVFVGLAAFIPWMMHQFGFAGAKFLPMHFFVIAAGLLFGWRAGLVVGVFSPLMSFSISQMPLITILPETILELSVYGLTVGILSEKKINIWLSLLSAMVLGRLARLLFVLSFGLNTNPLNYFQTSWQGIILQMLLIPMIVLLVKKILKK